MIESLRCKYVKAVAIQWVHACWKEVIRISFAYITLFGVLAGTFFTGCANTPVRLSSECRLPDSAQISSRPSKNCLLLISSIEDQRSTKESLGSVEGRFVYMNDIVAWLSSGLRLLEKYGYSCEFGTNDTQSSPQALRMTVALSVANIRSSSSSKTTSLVLKISYFRGDRFLGQRTYRGSSTGVNWFGSESEINDQFCEAFSQVLQAVSNDLAAYCTNK